MLFKKQWFFRQQKKREETKQNERKAFHILLHSFQKRTKFFKPISRFFRVISSQIFTVFLFLPNPIPLKWQRFCHIFFFFFFRWNFFVFENLQLLKNTKKKKKFFLVDFCSQKNCVFAFWVFSFSIVHFLFCFFVWGKNEKKIKKTKQSKLSKNERIKWKILANFYFNNTSTIFEKQILLCQFFFAFRFLTVHETIFYSF